MKIIVRNPNDDTNAKFKLKALTDGIITVNAPAGAIIKNEDNEWLTCLSAASTLISCAGASNKLFVPFDFDSHIAARPAGLESFWDWSMNGGYGDTPYGGWEAVFNSMREDDKIVDWDIYVDEIKIGTTHIVPLSRLNEDDPGYDENEMDLWFNEILSTVKGLGVYYPDALDPNEINADIETFFNGIVQTDGIDVVMPHKTIRALNGLVLVNKTSKPMRIKFVPSNPLVTMGNRWKAGFGIRPHSLTENYAYLLDMQPLAETIRGNDAVTVDPIDGSINICLNPAPVLFYPISINADNDTIFIADDTGGSYITSLSDRSLDIINAVKFSSDLFNLNGDVIWSPNSLDLIISSYDTSTAKYGLVGLRKSVSGQYDTPLVFDPPVFTTSEPGESVYSTSFSEDGETVIFYITHTDNILIYKRQEDGSYQSTGIKNLGINIYDIILSPLGDKFIAISSNELTAFNIDGSWMGRMDIVDISITDIMYAKPVWLSNDVIMVALSAATEIGKNLGRADSDGYVTVVKITDSFERLFSEYTEGYFRYIEVKNSKDNIILLANSESGDWEFQLFKVNLLTGELVFIENVGPTDSFENTYMQKIGDNYRLLYKNGGFSEYENTFDAVNIVLPIECVASPEEEFYYNLDSSYSDKTLALGYKLDDEENGITTGKVLSSTNDFADPSNLFYDLAGITGWKLSGGSIEPDELCVGGNKSLTAWIEVANLGSYDSNTYGAPKLDYVIDGVPGTITYSGGYVYKNAANHNNATEARAYYRELYQQFADGLTALGFVVEIHDGTLFRTVNIGNYFSYILKVTFSSGQFGTVSMGGNNIETGGNGPRWNPASFDYTCTVYKTPYNSPNEFGYRLGGYDGGNAYHFMPGGIVLTIDTCANLGITLDEGEVDMFTSLSRAEPIVITSCGAEQGG